MAGRRRRPAIGAGHGLPARRRRVAAGAVALVAALAAAALALRAPATERTATAGGLPPPVRPAFVPGPARPLAGQRYLSRWAPVQRPVLARASARAGAAVVAALSTRTPEGTQNIVAVLGHAVDAAGRPWVRVRLAVLPNGTTGWVPRGALGGYGTVDTRLDIDLERLRATLYRAGRPVLRAPIGAGMAGWDTPRGTFYIRNRLTRYRSAQYGPVAFGTSARSPVATDWPAGGFVGIHGTDQPGLIPGRISHGCIRLRNADILALARRMPIGTPVRVF
jgi:lipoprotein-anchoring transpeptidase ErfK/SrfK